MHKYTVLSMWKSLRLPSAFFLRDNDDDDDVIDDVMDALETLLALQQGTAAAVSLPPILSLLHDRVSAAACSPAGPSYPPITPGAMLSHRNDDRRRSQNDPAAGAAPRPPPPS